MTKKKFVYMLAILALAFTGCSDDDKDDNDFGPIPAEGTSLVSKITITYPGEKNEKETQVVNFSYDKKNRIANVNSKYEYIYDNELIFEENSAFNLNYSSETTIHVDMKCVSKEYDDEEETRSAKKGNNRLTRKNVKKYTPISRATGSKQIYEDVETFSASVILNSNGYITSGKSTYVDHDEEYGFTQFEEWTITYDDSSYISKSVFKTKKEEQLEHVYNYTYSWDEGNLMEIESTYVNLELIYGSTPNNQKINIDFNWVIDYTLAGIPEETAIFNYIGLYGNRSEKMIESFANKNVTYSYELDSQKRISKITTKRSGEVDSEMKIEYK